MYLVSLGAVKRSALINFKYLFTLKINHTRIHNINIYLHIYTVLNRKGIWGTYESRPNKSVKTNSVKENKTIDKHDIPLKLLRK